MGFSFIAGRYDAQPKARQYVYKCTVVRSCLHKAVGLLPPAWREPFAEWLLRRVGAPAPAMEHVVQYRLSLWRAGQKDKTRREATVAKAADNFYARHYRQSLNPKMGVFAMTAIQAVIASAYAPQAWLWRRHRPTTAAVIELPCHVPPVVVIEQRTVAVALLLPALKRRGEAIMADAWLRRRGPMPQHYRALLLGQEVASYARGVRARERSTVGNTIEVIDTAIRLRKLALLALHPYDPDAMGLHITLFGVEALSADQLERDYGLNRMLLDEHRNVASATGQRLLYLVGCTEEVFTQCSQNLFVKRPLAIAPLAQPPRRTWAPNQPLSQLLIKQFELLQVTVSASGLPGVSPRNGDLGSAGFIGHERQRPCLLIPYFPGNAVHGHAAKLLSNPYGTVIVPDDHDTHTRVLLSGPCRTVSHAWVTERFPDIVTRMASQRLQHGDAVAEPEYWFLQNITDIVQELAAMPANVLDPSRPTCSISAGGGARHNKKPAYFEADSLPCYDMHQLHRRERAGRVIDSAGLQHQAWQLAVEQALRERRAMLRHLTTVASVK